MPRRRVISKSVTWLSEEISNEQNMSNTFHYFKKFQFKDIIAEVGDYVLVSNADSAEPDTEEGCDAAKILALYEDKYNENDPFRARVQWYSKPSDLPKGCLNNREPINFLEKEVVEDHRPFDSEVSIETFYKKCFIQLTMTKDIEIPLTNSYHYACRYRLIAITKRKVNLEPVLEEERKALELLVTPKKIVTPKTPNSLVKKMGRVSLSERNWSVSKNDGTKLLLKRAILADKNDKEPPKTPEICSVTETPKSSKKLTKNKIEEFLSMELKENSDEELPTLIIRQHVPTTPKRKTPSRKTIVETPKKNLFLEEEKEYSTRSGRKTKNPLTYCEPEVSPVKRTPQKCHKISETSEDIPLTPKTPRTPRVPRTPKTPKTSVAKTPRSVKRILTSELTPTLHLRTHSVNNLNGR